MLTDDELERWAAQMEAGAKAAQGLAKMLADVADACGPIVDWLNAALPMYLPIDVEHFPPEQDDEY
jgi:hypothetical protein